MRIARGREGRAKRLDASHRVRRRLLQAYAEERRPAREILIVVRLLCRNVNLA